MLQDTKSNLFSNFQTFRVCWLGTIYPSKHKEGKNNPKIYEILPSYPNRFAPFYPPEN